MIAVGIFGLFAAGKDTAAEYLEQNYGFAHRSLPAYLRKEAVRQGIPTDNRPALSAFATELKAREGHEILAKLAMADAGEKTAYSGIRHPKEVELLKTIPGFILVEIVAPIELRHARAQARNRDKTDLLPFEEFKASEDRERKGTGGQLLDPIMEMVDIHIDNEGSLEELYMHLDDLVEKLSANS